MSVPVPPIPLENICSVMFDNALYTFSANGFQKLSLSEGAQWEVLPMGEPVTGGVCVGSTPKDNANAGLFIVGGTGVSADYPGLQKFTYSTRTWETIYDAAAATRNRRLHGATYVNATDSILMYAGDQENRVQPSSQTFTILSSRPHTVTSCVSQAPPVISPILLPWSETEVVLIGGDAANRRVMTFSVGDAQWHDTGASLRDPLVKDSNSVKAVLVLGDDGSKSLMTFDMTTVPNEVNRVVLIDAKGAAVANSAPIAARSESRETRRYLAGRALTLDQWPTYNGTLAPTSTRSNFALAQAPDGSVVFSGGNQDDILRIFDSRENTWENATLRFTPQKVLVASVSPSDVTTSATATSSTATSSGTATSTVAAAAPSGKDGISANSILGIVLGSILGLMLLLGLVLYLVRLRQKRRAFEEAGHARRASGAVAMEKREEAFGDDFTHAPAGNFRSHQHQGSAESFSSMAILMGRVNQQNKNLRRKASADTKRSSTSSIFNKEFKSTISKPIPVSAEQTTTLSTPAERVSTFGPRLTPNQAAPPPPRPPRGNSNPLDTTRRSSGWNRYWSGGSALNILGFGAPKRMTVESDRSSHYSDQPNSTVGAHVKDSGNGSVARESSFRRTQDSATVPPLFPEGRPEMNRVISGSPTVSQYSNKLALKQGMSGKIERPVSQGSVSSCSSGIPESIHDKWEPASAKKPWGTDRAPQFAYTGGNTALDPSSTSATNAPPGASKEPQLAMASTSSDMSWLNLGEYRRQ